MKMNVVDVKYRKVVVDGYRHRRITLHMLLLVAGAIVRSSEISQLLGFVLFVSPAPPIGNSNAGSSDDITGDPRMGK
jgi:hypothetical protein